MANDALAVNDATVEPQATYGITTHGSDWYFAVCAVMTVATFAFVGLGFTKPRTDRIFHYITAGVTMVAAIAYFTMGSHLGFTPIRAEFTGGNPSHYTREIYYARYIDWVITTPLLLLDLLLTAAMPTPSILFVILVDEVMIVTGLIGALVASSYKWGYFVFGCAALFYIGYMLAWEARRHANHVSAEAGKAFLYCGTLTFLLWFLYPIAWGVSEGANLIHPDSEAAFYGVLDLLAKPGFGALLLWGHRNISPASLGLRIRDYGEGDEVHHEKNAITSGTNGTSGAREISATNGTSAAHGTNGVVDSTASGSNGATHNTNTTSNETYTYTSTSGAPPTQTV